MKDWLYTLWENFVAFVDAHGWAVAGFFAILFLGGLLILLIIKALKRLLYKSPLDHSVCAFVLSLARFLLGLALVLAALSVLRIPFTSLVAVIGAAGLAIGLALQGSLSNMANGIVIIFTKPFREGDWVELAGTAGAVKKIKILSTELVSSDNKKIIIPNAQITSGTLVNFSARPTRRVDLEFSVSHAADLDEVLAVLTAAQAGTGYFQASPAPVCRISDFNNLSVTFILRGWVQTADYWDAVWSTREAVVRAFHERGIQLVGAVAQKPAPEKKDA
jgi:small conductance mechanosensitive channel